MNSRPVDLDFVTTLDNEDYLIGIDFDDYSMGIDGSLKNFSLDKFVSPDTIFAMTDEIASDDSLAILDASDTSSSSLGRFKTLPALQFARINLTWYDVSYCSGWAGYGGGYYNPNYNKVGNHVALRGQIKRASGTGAAMFTLPVGYRPSAKVRLLVITDSGPGYIEIETDGNAKYISGGVGWISLDGLLFTL